MKKLRSTLLAAAASAMLAGGADAAETYVSLGLGIAEEKVTMNSLVPGDSACSTSTDFYTLSVVCGGQPPGESRAEFEIDNAFAGSASVGFEWESWRLEVEYSGREHGGGSQTQPVSPASVIDTGWKGPRWCSRYRESIRFQFWSPTIRSFPGFSISPTEPCSTPNQPTTCWATGSWRGSTAN